MGEPIREVSGDWNCCMAVLCESTVFRVTRKEPGDKVSREVWRSRPVRWLSMLQGIAAKSADLSLFSTAHIVEEEN